ncbi:AAA family ATPase [Nocardia sp. NEAU-G5]|uniref:AAA family ATPase n=1 Tax=Nocardia albiluteola TaxID=2842303 RepID=A0ABS6AYB5_9NOCA|nr:LuxR family transcriptional regulator [Nocardia albiluteola]MBU3063022.1 AAA family ATPase [Nocardia albiluteola]
MGENSGTVVHDAVVELLGRQSELSAIGAVLDRAREGGSAALVLRGEPGIGKSALLDHAAASAGSLRVLRGAGIEVEAELPFAGLQLLLLPAVRASRPQPGAGGLAGLPEPQRAALETALGLGAGAGRDPMLIGLAVLSLLAEYAGESGVVVLVDDAQWLDHASREVMLFAARRLHAEGVVMIFAARDGEGAFAADGLPERRLAGLPPEAAAALLDAHDLGPALRYGLLAVARGNPLALRELPIAMAAEPSLDLRATALPLTDRLRLAFHGQVSRLPAATQGALLVVAAEETGEPAVVFHAAKVLGVDIDDFAPAERAGLIGPVVGGGADAVIAFRHPLIRAAVYARAPLGRRLAVHRALAEALVAPEYADRRAWHLAAAAAGPDAEVADLLEGTATRARERGGYQAAAAAYERSARLTAQPELRARREALSAQSALEAGDLERARRLADRAARHTDDIAVRANLLQVQALASFWQRDLPAAHRMLVNAADLIADSDPGQSAALLLQAVHPAWHLGNPAVVEVLERLRKLTLPPEHPITPAAAFVAQLLDTGPGAPPLSLTHTLAEIRVRGQISDYLLVLLCGAAMARGQDGEAYTLATAMVRQCRETGAAGRLPTVLGFVADIDGFTGRLDAGLTAASEALELARDTGQRQWGGHLSGVIAYLQAMGGQEQSCRDSAAAGLAGDCMGAGAPVTPWAHWALGVLELGLGRAEAALTRLERLTREPFSHQFSALRSVPDLVESAVRAGAPERAAAPLARFEAWAESVRQPWADALVLRCRALLHDEAAEQLYIRALAAHDADGRPVEYARTALLFGEWLRRARRKAPARTQLSEALTIFERLGMEPWARRARHELVAAGAPDSSEVPRDRAVAGLTPQELQIVRLAAQGLSNRDIAAQLFLSHRTVGYHLYKAYPKLGVTSRGELKGIAAQLE